MQETCISAVSISDQLPGVKTSRKGAHMWTTADLLARTPSSAEMFLGFPSDQSSSRDTRTDLAGWQMLSSLCLEGQPPLASNHLLVTTCQVNCGKELGSTQGVQSWIHLRQGIHVGVFPCDIIEPSVISVYSRTTFLRTITIGLDQGLIVHVCSMIQLLSMFLRFFSNSSCWWNGAHLGSCLIGAASPPGMRW